MQSSVFHANNRVITHLGYSPFEIRFRYKLASLVNKFKPLVKLKQINGSFIPRSFYRDHLKLFKPRTGYLVTGKEEAILQFQNIRAGQAKFLLPLDIHNFTGVWEPTY